MNILLVTEYYWPHVGGVEVVFKNLAEGLAARGHRVNVVTSRVPETPVFETVNNVRIRRINVPVKGDRYFFTWMSVPWVWRLVRRADVVHGTLYTAAWPTWFVAKLRRKPCVLTVHEVFGARWRERFPAHTAWAGLHRWLERALLMLPFDRYVAVSEATARDLCDHKDPNKVSMIHNGIDTEHFNPARIDRNIFRKKWALKPDEYAFLYYGRPGISKGVDVLVRAFSRVEDSKARLVLILSEKPKKSYDAVKKLIKNLDLGARVILKKSVPYRDLPGFIMAADTVVVPSLAEGFGFAAAESAAMERPLIVTKAGSLPEVAHGNVLLAEPGDPASLAHAMTKALAGKFRAVAKKTFRWDANVDAHLNLYRELCRKD